MARGEAWAGFFYAVLFAVLLGGCAAAPVALIPAAVPALIAGAGGGISYTFTNVAFRTITRPTEEIERASLKAMEKMSIRVDTLRHREHDTEIFASTRDLRIHINLERMTPTLTRVKVNAKRGLIFKDKNTAFEIIYQTEFFLAETGMEAGRATRLPETLQHGARQNR